LETIAKGQTALAEVQRQQNEVKQAELQLNAMIAGENAALQREKLALARQAHQENLAQQASLARKERELKVQLSEQWCNLIRGNFKPIRSHFKPITNCTPDR
jgi:flagellar motor protein MotB